MYKYLLILILASQSFLLSAQLVNIEKKRKDYKEGFQGQVITSLSITQNTSRITQLALTTHFQYVKKRHTFLVLGDNSLMKVKSKNDKADLINNNFQHFRYNFSLLDTNKISFEYFFQRQQNKIKYLDLRLISGIGTRFNLLKTKVVDIHIAPLIMYEREILNDSLRTTTNEIKADIYFTITVDMNKNIYFSNVTYYQPTLINIRGTTDFEPIKDFRLFSETFLSFKLLKNIEYSVGFVMAYDSRPPVELINQPLFYNLKNQLIFNF